MRRFKMLVGSAVMGSWAMLGLCGNLEAQIAVDPLRSELSPIRGSWEQRVLGQGDLGRPGWQSAAGRSSPAQEGAIWVPAGTMSMAPRPATVVDESELPPDEAEVIPQGVQVNPLPMEGSVGQPKACGVLDAGCGPHCSGSAQCTRVCCNGCDWGWPGCGPRQCFRDFCFFAGVHGFKGPPDRGRNGNFGFHEGVNWGAPLSRPSGIGYQVGFQAVHSNFFGDQVAGIRRGDRDQIFLTAGLFRRAVYDGLQWGTVFDYLHDAYYDTADFGQIRAELSWAEFGQREIGFWGAFGTGRGRFTDPVLGTLVFQPTDLFAFFYRRYFSGGGQGRLWTGFTGEGDALMGADCTVPLGARWALECNFNYLVPQQARGWPGQMEESWGLTVQLVWYFGRGARSVRNSPYYPLFNVADNSVFMLDRD